MGIGAEERRAESGESKDDRLALPPSFGDYEFLEEIARGGMGVVYKARQLSLNRIVALKMILTGRLANAVELQRFRAEAEMAARLQHPNIVAIYEVAEQDAQPFFVMEYVEGQSLAELAHNQPLPAKRAAGYLKTIAEAVHYAHSRGVLHRDLKPSNILIDHSDQPRITDFGLAKRIVAADVRRLTSPSGGQRNELDQSLLTSAATDLTISGQVLGSPNFMPPEQAAGDRLAIAPASDVYSLGAILYHLLTGRPPFLAETMTQTLRLVAELEAPSPRLLSPGLSRDLETICLKCLQKDPARRYSSANTLAEDLAHFLSGEPIQARPVGQGERLWRWCRRKPALAGAATSVIMLLLTVAIGSTVAAARLRAANRAGREKLRESLISQAHAGRWSGRVGQRFDGLEAVKKAAEIRLGIDLRNEAIACLALIDLRTTKILNAPDEARPAFNRTLERYLAPGSDGQLRLRRVSDGTELASFAITDIPIRFYRLSPSERYLCTYHHKYPNNDTNVLFQIYDTKRREQILAMPHVWVRGVDFSRDEDRLFTCENSDRQPLVQPWKAMVHTLATGESRELFSASVLPSALLLDPRGARLAFASEQSKEVQIRDSANGHLLFPLPHPAGVHSLAWHPEGRLMAACCADGNLYLWDLETRQPRILSGHESQVVNARFSHDGNRIGSAAWDSTFRLWNVWNGRQILTRPCFNAGIESFSPDDRRLGIANRHAIEICEMAGGHEWRALFPRQIGQAAGGWKCAWDSDGRLTASAHRDGIRLWNSIAGRELAKLQMEAGDCLSAIFDPTGTHLIGATGRGLRVWPLEVQPTEFGDRLVVGQAQSFGPDAPSDYVFLNRAGTRLAAIVGGAVEVFEWPSGHPLRSLRLAVGIWIDGCAVSPSGQFFAAWSNSGRSITVWDVGTEAQPKSLELTAAGVGAAFTPDDRWLITGTGEEYTGWNVKTWSPAWKLSRPDSGGTHGRVAFTTDGTMGALTLSAQTIRLFNPATGSELATLEAPEPLAVSWLAFSPDGSQLLASTQTGILHLWDLRLIRQQLTAMKLDWDTPPFSVSQVGKPLPITVKVRGVPDSALEGQLFFPARDPLCRSSLIDLTSSYNASLTNSWFNASYENNDLSTLPHGLQLLDGIEFDIRGIVQLSSSNPAIMYEYPPEVANIPIHRLCRTIHFLHSSGWGLDPLDGDIAEYVAHYEDGVERSVPVVYAENIGNWWGTPGYIPPLKTGTTLAWRGRNSWSERYNQDLLLFHFRCENPRPNVPIATITFRSRMTRCAPFLIAITVE